MSDLCPPQLHLHQETLATRTLVVPTQMLQCEAPAASARVAQNTLETLMLAAGLNVLSTLTVQLTRPVSTENVKTPALAYAVSMHIAV